MVAMRRMEKWIRNSVWALLLCSAHWSVAQTPSAVGDSTVKNLDATDYFNTASKKYVKEQKIDALKTLDKGLKAHPGDPRLLKLAEELIKEEENKQQQQQQQQQQQEQQKEQDQKEQDSKPEESKEQDEKQKPEDSKEKEAEEKKSGEEQKQEPGRISEKDAERILDAMDREEKAVQNKVREKQRPTERRTIDKDW